ncbi:MAG TPA: alcohol dehydrogenase catalytic domain-containing protein [Blastocatellia bacterium]|nr:alcohol dehydrogenase catalytic domain-containing protein [Blastocatellia bacterium]
MNDAYKHTTMRAAVLCDTGRMEIRDATRPDAGPGDVLVRVSAVGLCGTDFHIFSGEANYNTDDHGAPIPLARHPQILGHEIAGIVEEVGSETENLRAGDRVVLDQGLNCVSLRRAPVCEYCSTGNSHQCAFYREHGITGLAGGLADYIAVPAVNAIRVDSDLDSAEAALTEPLGCIVHSSDMVERAHARYSVGSKDDDRRARSVLICGAGPAGLLFTQYLRNALGFDGLLMVSEPNARKRNLAAGFGAEVINPATADVIEAVREMTGGRRVEYLIEATGSGEIYKLIPGLIRKQATVLMYGHGLGGVDLRVMNNIMFMEPRLVASVGASGGFDADGRPSTYRRALNLIETGRIDVGSFITNRYASLDSVPDAFAGAHADPDYVKGVVTL